MAIEKRLLNLGCGRRFHPDWINLDFSALSKQVIAADLRLGVPFSDDSMDVVYHSHVLEHFTRSEGRFFLRECLRVLKPGGLLRIAVPDLEAAARAYIKALDDVRESGTQAALHRHEWMTIELVDQMVRTEPGGEMLRYWARSPVPEKEFMLSRAGEEATECIARLEQAPLSPKAVSDAVPAPFEAAFLQSGELHKWMYDAPALSRLLAELGFTGVQQVGHDRSLSKDILRSGLDVAEDGSARKPDSFFMEAIKPGQQAKKTRILVLSTSDGGGAGIAARRLHSSLRQGGLNSLMYVRFKQSRDEGVYLPPIPGQRAPMGAEQGAYVLPGYFECEHKRVSLLSRKYPEHVPNLEYFTTPGPSLSLEGIPLIADFDLISLNWMSCFLDPAAAIQGFQGKPLVWTVHDMHPFTGGCHYAGSCTRYKERCGCCPLLGSKDPEDISFQTWRARMGAFKRLDLHVVCTTRWMAERVRQSSLLGKKPVEVIPYALPLDLFRPREREGIRSGFGFSGDDFVLMFSAQSMSVERKGARYLLDALRRIPAGPLRSQIKILLIGKQPDQAFFETGFSTHYGGFVSDNEQLARFYNAADLFVFPSLEEAFGQVAAEATACGTPTVAFAAGGIPEIVEHKKTGWLADIGDAEGLATGFDWLYAQKDGASIRRRCRASALEKWNANQTTKRYIELFERLAAKA